MADVAVLTDIRTMIDLAIGTPEVGVVDFCMLHTVLHCLAQQLQVLDKPVELHGDVASTLNVVPADKDQGQTVAIKEYLYETDVSSPRGVSTEQPMTLKPQTQPVEPPSLLVVERVRKDSIPAGLSGRVPEPEKPRTESHGKNKQKIRDKMEKQEEQTRGPEEHEPRSRHEESQHVEPRPLSSTEKLSLVTLSKFNLLEVVVQDLKDRVYGSMPKNEQILEEVRSQTNLKAITDMWTNLNVSSRLEAAETGLAKLSSLVEDLIREVAAHGSRDTSTPPAPAPPVQAPPVQAPPAPAPSAPAPPAPASPAPAPSAPAPSALAPPAPAPPEQVPPAQTPPELPGQDPLAQFGPPYPWDTMAAELYDERMALVAQLQRLRYDLDLLSEAFYTAMQNMEDGLDPKETASKIIASAPPPPPPLPPLQVAPPPLPTLPTPAATRVDGDLIQERRPERRSSGANAGMMDRLAQLEKRIKECCDSIGKDKGVARDQLNNFQDQLDNIMRQTSSLRDAFNALNISPDLARDLEGVALLYQTVQDLQNQLEQINDTVLRLAGERDDRQHHMNALLEQIEILKTIKMDREDMAEAMAEKADLRLLARKVSQDQFEMACDDLSRGLEHALGKLNTQESLWQQVLDDVQREIESKLDKMELSPLKEFFNNKLRQLQENLKQMASLRRDVEAAGTTRRLLRDVNCISCAAEAVMAMENAAVAPSKPMPAHLSMKPYLSYELDAIRKTQASNLPQRNLHDWETIDKQMTPKPPVKVRSETDKHICNRYCGGSHTTTTPAQRVARTGHFIKQWGPDVVPLSSRLAAGDDGRLYKVSSTEHANVGPGGTKDPPCTKKPKPTEPSKPPPKPAAFQPECRCLDGSGGA